MFWMRLNPAIKITLVYLILGGLWILFSDKILMILVDDPLAFARGQTHKGWFYVALTGILLYFLILRSLNRMKKAQDEHNRELRESERQLSSLMANLPGMAFRCLNDDQWTMLFVSNGCEDLTGYRADELQHNRHISYNRIIHPEDQTGVFADTNAAIEQKSSYKIKYRIITRSGVMRWVMEQAEGVWDDAGRLLFIEGIITDISEPVAAREELALQLEKTKVINTELERFTRNVSHDLRSPLLTIKGYLELIDLDLKEGNYDKVRLWLERSEKSVLRMQGMMDYLLQLSRLGKEMGAFSRFNAREVVQEALDNLDGLIRHSGGNIVIQNSFPLLLADRAKMVLVFQNLIENAIKFRSSRRPCEIYIGCVEETGHFVFSIKDNGIGLLSGNQQEIFDVFFQLDTRSEGSGFGLAYVKRIIENHSGKIWVESAGSENGCCFFFTLPKPISDEPMDVSAGMEEIPL